MTNDKRLEAIQKMLESLIKEDAESASEYFSEYAASKTRALILGEQDRASQFSNSGKVMSDKVEGDLAYKKGGKKTLKKHGNASKDLDDNIKGNIKFKNGGKQPAKVLEKTPKPAHFDDGRRFPLGTTS